MEATLRFELRKDFANTNGERPLSLIVRYGGQRRRLSTGITFIPELWDSQAQRAITLTAKLKSLLEKKYDKDILSKNEIYKKETILFDLIKKIRDFESKLNFENTPYNAEILIDHVKEINIPVIKEDAPLKNVFDFIDNYIRDNELTRVKGSLVVYKSLKKHLNNYQKETKSKIQFDKIDYAFMQSFQNFLIGWKEINPKTNRVKSLNNTSVAKQLSTLKTFLGYARRQGIAVNMGYKDFSIKKEKLEVIALTQSEFEALAKIDLSTNKKLDQVRDVFIFSCVTGYRYSDLLQLKRDHIKSEEIKLTIKKTKELSIVPLNGYAVDILNKYKDRISPLPMISNQKFNKYVKELCKKAGIIDPVEIIRYKGAVKEAVIYPKHEIISAHTGRKTFATLSLEKGIPSETVMKITGHSDYKSFQRYIKITEERKRNEMQKAWGKPT